MDVGMLVLQKFVLTEKEATKVVHGHESGRCHQVDELAYTSQPRLFDRSPEDAKSCASL
jgi:hypothetical protein